MSHPRKRTTIDHHIRAVPILNNNALNDEEKINQIKQMLFEDPNADGLNECGHILIYKSEFDKQYEAMCIAQMTEKEKQLESGDLLVNASGRYEYRLLSETVKTGNCAVAKWLIESQGASVNLQDSHGRTALDEAYRMRNDEMIEMLIAKGAKANITKVYPHNTTQSVPITSTDTNNLPEGFSKLSSNPSKLGKFAKKPNTASSISPEVDISTLKCSLI